MKPTRAMILVPCGTMVYAQFLQTAMVTAMSAWKNGIEVIGCAVTGRVLIHSARNRLAEVFLKSDAEYAFWMDDDMVIPAETMTVMIRKMQKIGAKIGTGVYYQRGGLHKPLVMVKDPFDVKTGKKFVSEGWTHNHVLIREGLKDPFKIDACGFGCVVTHRDAFKDMATPYFKFWDYDNSGKEVSEDFYFCIQARKLGIDIWCFPEFELGHMGDPYIYTKKDFKLPAEDPMVIQVDSYKQQQAEGYSLVEVQGDK